MTILRALALEALGRFDEALRSLDTLDDALRTWVTKLEIVGDMRRRLAACVSAGRR